MAHFPGLTGGGGELNAHAHGSARWMTAEEAEELHLYDYRPGSIILGQNQDGWLCCLNRQGHVIVLAPPRTGKGVGFVQANLAGYQGSMVVTDPKGENAAVAHRHRSGAMNQNVVVLDPTQKLQSYGMDDPVPIHSFNPLSVFDNANYAEVLDDVGMVADALLVPKEGEKEQHWRDGARAILCGLLTYLLFFVPRKDRNLIMLARIGGGLEGSLDEIFSALTLNEHPDPVLRDVISKTGTWWDKVNLKERASFLSLALRSLAWLNSPVWHDHLRTSDFHPYDLKQGSTTVFIVCPFEKLELYSPWIRLVLSCCIVATLRAPFVENVPPVLFMLDEYAAAVGRLAVVEQSMAFIEGTGGRFALIFQYLSQMQKLWPDPGYHGIFAGAGAHVFFNVNDQHTAEYVSKFIGQHGAMLPTAGMLSFVQRDLLKPDEVRTLPQNDLIAFVRGYRPAWISKLDVRSHQAFEGRLLPNPTYGTPRSPKQLGTWPSDEEPLLRPAATARAEKVQSNFDQDALASTIAAKYPDKDICVEGDMLGYREACFDPVTCGSEWVFVPLMHVSLLTVL
ncbi:MAG: type IV secretory system conjugative DNA transfer family protein [Armatimonadetes bacterium]|nr:type IV secretory system conjugative DNA transfer family protein [Armatimonadota bacterium]